MAHSRKTGARLPQWVVQLQPDEVVMESTGIYWKSPYAALEAAGIRAKVVNARHVKNVPGRKTDINDAQWLATLSRAGLLRASFIPPAKMRELRLIARQRQKLTGQLASEKNRLHKILADGGIRLGVVVSDVHGQSARAMIKALIANKMPQEVLKFASRRLKASREELFDALQGELTESHRFVLNELMHQSLEYSTPDKVYLTASGGGAKIIDKYSKTENISSGIETKNRGSAVPLHE